MDLGAHAGLREWHLMQLCWSHVGEDAVTFGTGKSRRRREAIIRLYDDLRAVLARIPKQPSEPRTASPRPSSGSS